jgi:hypothetical protein
MGGTSIAAHSGAHTRATTSAAMRGRLVRLSIQLRRARRAAIAAKCWLRWPEPPPSEV